MEDKGQVTMVVSSVALNLNLNMLYLQVLHIGAYHLQMREKSTASTLVGILHSMKLTSLCCRQ